MVDQIMRDVLIAAVADLEESEVLELVKKRLLSDDNPLTIVEDCQKGLRQVGIL